MEFFTVVLGMLIFSIKNLLLVEITLKFIRIHFKKFCQLPYKKWEMSYLAHITGDSSSPSEQSFTPSQTWIKFVIFDASFVPWCFLFY